MVKEKCDAQERGIYPMRLILKILAAPFVVALTLAVAFFAFLLHLSSIIFGLASTLLFLCSRPS